MNTEVGQREYSIEWIQLPALLPWSDPKENRTGINGNLLKITIKIVLSRTDLTSDGIIYENRFLVTLISQNKWVKRNSKRFIPDRTTNGIDKIQASIY